MSNLCSLPWCRKPINNRKKARNFPSDRPSQLAWLDSLDAGAWFSIPPETLCTGLILCDCHFDSKGNVRRRYEVSEVPPPNIKVEPNMPEDLEEHAEEDSAEDTNDSDYNPGYSGKRKRRNVQKVRVNIVRVRDKPKGSRRSQIETCSSTGSKRSRANLKAVNSGSEKSDSEDAEEAPDMADGFAGIDSERLSELTNDAMERSGDRKRNSAKRKSVTLMQKMEVIRMVDKGEKQTQIAKKMNLRRSTVWQIVQMRDKIEEAYRGGAPLRKRIVRRGAFQDVNDAVYQWYEKVRTQNLYVNARVLLTMAENIANELGRTDFNPSPNWLSRFKERYNIRFTSSQTKPRSKVVVKTKKESTEEFEESDGNEDNENEEQVCNLENEQITLEDEDAWLKKDWLSIQWPENRIKHRKSRELYTERDTFFVEELGILYRITPKEAWQFKSAKNVEALKTFSITEERLTVMMCANADGSEKRKLVIAGQALSGIPSNLPVDYVSTADPSNWITKSVFSCWINAWNRTLESQKRKVILLSSSSPIHTLTSTLSSIKIVNIPTRILASVHPVNGIATNFKSRYRRLLLEKLINTGGSRPVTCLEAIFMLSTAWNELSPNLIRAAFIKSGYFSCNSLPDLMEEDCDCSSLMSKAAELDLAVSLSKYSFAEYVEIDNSLCAIECTVIRSANNETCSEVNDQDTEDFADDSQGIDNSDNFVPVQCNLNTADAQAALESVRLYAMSRPSCPQEVHNALSTIESFLLGHGFS